MESLGIFKVTSQDFEKCPLGGGGKIQDVLGNVQLFGDEGPGHVFSGGQFYGLVFLEIQKSSAAFN